MNKEFYEKYPFIKDLEKELPNFCKYKSYNDKEELLLSFIKDNGVWKDITKIELAKIELEKTKIELSKLGVDYDTKYLFT